MTSPCSLLPADKTRQPHPAQSGHLLLPLLSALLVSCIGTLILITSFFSAKVPWGWLAVVFIVLLTAASGAVTYWHIRKVEKIRGAHIRELSAHFDKLDVNVLGNKIAPSLALANIYQRIDAVAQQARLFRDIAEGVHGVEALFSLDGKLLWISPSIERLTGHSPHGLLASPDALSELIDTSDLSFCKSMVQKLAAGSHTEDFEMRLLSADGQIRWVASHWRPMRNEKAGTCCIRMSAEDIQVRKETEYKLLETVAEVRRSDALREHYLSRSTDERTRLSALLNAIQLGILFVDRDQRVLYYNRAMLDIWHFPSDENLLGLRFSALQERITDRLASPDAFFQRIGAIIEKHDDSTMNEIPFRDGRIVTDVSAVIKGSGDGQLDLGRIWIYEDITEQRRIDEQLVQLAERDPLTNLFNRRRFHEDLERLLADASRNRHMVGLIMIDLDNFKPINDEFGHQIGDKVLVTLTHKVGGLIRRNETFFRLGGDEFCVLVPEVDKTGLGDLARRISSGIATLSFDFNDRDLSLTASLGMALYPLHALDRESLIAAADHAMYAAKNSGRNRCIMAQAERAG